MLGKLPTAGLCPPRRFDDTDVVRNQFFSEGVFRGALNCFFFPEKNLSFTKCLFVQKIIPYNTPVNFCKSQPDIFLKNVLNILIFYWVML